MFLRAIKLTPGPVKDLIWRDRQEIAMNEDVLFQKFQELCKYFLKRGFSIKDARGSACMYLSFPYMRTLVMIDEQELLDVMNDIYDIVNHYEMLLN